jgi:hypothetical protein
LSNAVAQKADVALQVLNLSAQLLCCVLAAAPEHNYRNCENKDEEECHEDD